MRDWLQAGLAGAGAEGKEGSGMGSQARRGGRKRGQRVSPVTQWPPSFPFPERSLVEEDGVDR